MIAEPQSAEAEYYVLKRGDTFGPFSHRDLVEGLESGKFAPDDFVQVEGETNWGPLGSALGRQGALPDGVAPSWETILKIGWLRLRNTVEERSFVAGGVCLGLGTACMILAAWPFVFCAPWFAAAAVAAAVLLRRKRRTPGALVLAAALCIPLAVCILPLKTGWRSLNPFSSRPSTTTRNSPVPPPPEAAAPPGSQATSDIPGLPPLDPSPGPADSSQTPTPNPGSPQETAPTPVRVAPHYAQQPGETPGTPFATTTPGSATPAPPGAGAPAMDAVGLESAYASSLVVANGDEGSGSGFICKSGATTLLYTNIHVVTRFKGLTFTRNDGPVLLPGRGELAAGRDIARFEVTPVPSKPLEMITNFESNVRIGDAVVVLGNSGGGGVVTALPGVINGIGPDRIEVSAQFIPGNSGSPIIHINTGKVIGIATYHTLLSADPKKGIQSSIRRFGYRIDNGATWESISWPAFQRDVESLKKISAVSEDLMTFVRSFPNVQSQTIQTENLRRDYADWASTMWLTKAKAERISASDRFLRALKFICTADISAAEQQLTYTYFREDLEKQKKMRSQITTAIDNAENLRPSTLTSGHL